MEQKPNIEMIKKSILFYQSRNFSVDEMVSDIASIMHVSQQEVLEIYKAMKK